MRQRAILLAACGLLLAKSAAQPQGSAKSVGRCGPLAGQIFQCPKFGFTYKVAFGWVDRTEDMQQPAPDQNAPEKSVQPKSAEQPSQPANSTSAAESQTLLAIFERPPNAPGETINSAVVVAAESRADYPQIKTAADYFGPISDLAEQSGLKPVSDPYAFPVGTKRLVREDFSGARGKLNMYQSSLVMIEKGQIVSFTFVAGSEDDVDDLIDSLEFGASIHKTQR